MAFAQTLQSRGEGADTRALILGKAHRPGPNRWNTDHGSNPMSDRYEELQNVDVELDGVSYQGRFRVVGHSVIVYFESEIKFVDYGMNRPETVARWMLSDLAWRPRSNKRRPVRR